MKKDFTATIIYFPEVYDIAYELSRQITDSSESFDAVIGIARGGLIPARLICDFLNIDNLTSLQIRHYKSGAEELEDAEMTDPVDIDIKGKNVLIVDDVNDSGKTMRYACEHVRSLEPAMFKTVVLHEKENTVFNTHFIGKKIERWKWLIYQWAVTEDLLEFLSRDNKLQASEEEAINHLAEKYDLEVGKELFQKVIKMEENYI